MRGGRTASADRPRGFRISNTACAACSRFPRCGARATGCQRPQCRQRSSCPGWSGRSIARAYATAWRRR